MTGYILRRLLLMIPTLFGIMVVNFVIIQFAPGGPVEQVIATLSGGVSAATARIGGSELGETSDSSNKSQPSKYLGSRGVDPELIAELERQFGFDRPAHERFFKMLYNFVRFDFGDSYFRDRAVVDLIIEKMPVSISLGVWTTLLIYAVSIPLGIKKAVRDGSRFDIWSSLVIIVGYAIPGFMFAVLLIVVFAGGSYLDWFPLRGLVSPDWAQMSWPQKVADYFWHLTLPIIAMLISGFASLTMLTKNSFLEEINKQYVLTAHSKGVSEKRVLYGHVFRNAMLIVVAGFPSAIVAILFTSQLLIEIIFSLDGLGLLGFESVVNRDYPVIFATVYLFTLLGLVLHLVGDVMYMVIDPRIDFESRGG